jgi:hypothetical protein
MMSAGRQPGPLSAAPDEDAAWVEIATPLSLADLRTFLDDIERLFRINPLLEISAFESIGDNTYRLAASNLSNGRKIDVVLAVARGEASVEVHYHQGLKTSTSFRAEPAHNGATLVVRDNYGRGSSAERRARVDEVDLSLNAWGRALHEYLHAWARWRWLAPWRWYMRRVWQPMTPSARRIVWMIWIISALEVAASVVLLAIWLVFRHGRW